MTKEEFEEGYCKRSGISLDEYNKYEITLPCSCEDEDCEGWAAVSNNSLLIEAHKKFYMS